MLTSISNRTNTLLLVLLVLMAGTIIAILATRASGGPLDPPGPGASTQSNIIYQPTSCAAFPIVISTPGSYRLGGNITGCNGKDGIQIASGDVTLSLAGFSVIGVPGSLIGIKNVGGNGQLNIADGIVVTWGGTGINLTGSSTARMNNIIAAYNGGDGMQLGSTSSMSHSTSSANGGFGIRAAATNITISDCNVDYNGGYGIYLTGAGSVVDGCEVGGHASGGGIQVSDVARVMNNYVHNNGDEGIYATGSCTIEGNTVEWNGTYGINVTGDRCSVAGNTANSNGAGGIHFSGGASHVDRNHTSGNGNYGFDINSVALGYANIVTGNSSTGDSSTYHIGANNDAGPIVTAASAGANPWSNVAN
jgi:hypothetical protein